MIRLTCKANDVIDFGGEVIIRIVSAKGGNIKLEIEPGRYGSASVSQNTELLQQNDRKSK